MQRHFQKRVEVSFWKIGFFFFGSGNFSILSSACFEDDICSKHEGRRYSSRYVTLSFDLQGKFIEYASYADVGHGTGESLLLLLSDPSIPRPSHLIGITSLHIHHHRSRQRVDKWQAINQNKVSVDLHHRDAVFDGVVPSTHPLSPSCKITIDSILALDCAHHFNTRHKFLEQSFQKLTPGGSIALADICSSVNTQRTRLITSTVNLIPRHNQISVEDYVHRMEQIGYVDVILEDITPEVFPGFVSFMKSRGWGWWAFGSVVDWYSSTGARFVIVSGRRPA